MPGRKCLGQGTGNLAKTEATGNRHTSLMHGLLLFFFSCMAVINSTNTHSLLPYRWPKKSTKKNPKKVNSLIYKDYTLVQHEDGTKSYVSPEEKIQLLVDGKIKEEVERRSSMKKPKDLETEDSDSGYEVPIRGEGRPKSCEDLDRPVRPEIKRNSSFPFSDFEAPGDGGRINLPPYIVPVETSLTFPMTKRKKKDKKRKESERGSEKLLRNLDETVIDFPADFRVRDSEEEAESKKAKRSTGFWGRIGKRGEDGEPQEQQKPLKNRFTVPWTKHKEKSEPEDEEEGEKERLDKPEVSLGVDPKPFSLKLPRLSWSKGKKEKMGSSEELEEEKKKNFESESHSDDKEDVGVQEAEEKEEEKPEAVPADANKSTHFALKMPKISFSRGRKDKTGEDPEKESERGKKRDFVDGEDEEEEEKPELVSTDAEKPKHFALKMPRLSLSRSKKDKTEEEAEKEKEGDFHAEEVEEEEKPEPGPSGSEKPKRFSLKMPKLSFNKSVKQKIESPEEHEKEEEKSEGTLDSKHSEEEELEDRPEVKEEFVRRNVLEAEPGLDKPEEIFPVEGERKSYGFPRLASEVPKGKEKRRTKGKIEPNPLRKMFGKRGAKRERDPSPAELPGGARPATETHPEGDEDRRAGPEEPEPGPGVRGVKSSEDEGGEEGEARDGEVAAGHSDDGSDTESADHGTHKSSMATLTSGKRSGSLIGGVLGFFKSGKTDKNMVDIADNGAVKTNLPSLEATPEKAPPEEPLVEGSKPDGIVYAELDMARFPGNVMRREDEKTEYAEIIYPGTKLSPERAMEELRKSRENLSSSRENLTEVDEAFSTMTTTPEGKKEAAV